MRINSVIIKVLITLQQDNPLSPFESKPSLHSHHYFISASLKCVLPPHFQPATEHWRIDHGKKYQMAGINGCGGNFQQ